VNAQAPEKCPEGIAQQAKVVERVLTHIILIAAFPDKRCFISLAKLAYPIGTVPADIDSITGLVPEFLFCNRPAEFF
jgi:hypothetical protein